MIQNDFDNKISKLPVNSIELYEHLITEAVKLNWVDSMVSFKYLISALKIGYRRKDNFLINRCLIPISENYLSTKDLKKALKVALRSKAFFKKKSYYYTQTNQNIACIYYDNNSYSEALAIQIENIEIYNSKEFLVSDDYPGESRHMRILAMAYNSIGTIYKELNLIEESLNYYELCKNIVNKNLFEECVTTISPYINIGCLQNISCQYDSAIKNLNYALEVATRIQSNRTLIFIHNQLSQIFFKLKDVNNFLKNSELAQELSEKCNFFEYLEEIYTLKLEYYSQKKDFKKALEYSLKINALKESNSVLTDIPSIDKIAFKTLKDRLVSFNPNQIVSAVYFDKYSEIQLINETIMSKINVNESLKSILSKVSKSNPLFLRLNKTTAINCFWNPVIDFSKSSIQLSVYGKVFEFNNISRTQLKVLKEKIGFTD